MEIKEIREPFEDLTGFKLQAYHLINQTMEVYEMTFEEALKYILSFHHDKTDRYRMKKRLIDIYDKNIKQIND